VNDEATAQLARLCELFDAKDVKFRPAVVAGNRALALAYVEPLAVQQRLEEVLGAVGWQDGYELVGDGTVLCKLRLLLGGEWVAKMDVGAPSEQADAGDRQKAAFGDALVRAAAKFGIGRYLQRLPAQWVDYDPSRRQFLRTPALPDFAKPRPKAAPQ
jgi:hypothetical protein